MTISSPIDNDILAVQSDLQTKERTRWKFFDIKLCLLALRVILKLSLSMREKDQRFHRERESFIFFMI